VKGRVYWYHKRRNPDGSYRQLYVGPETPELLERIRNHKNLVNAERMRRDMWDELATEGRRRGGIPANGLIVGLVVATLGLRLPAQERFMTADTVVRSRIDTDTKERAAAALGAMGLTISDAIRLLLLRVADEKRLPFEVKVPNAASRAAMKELMDGKGKRSASVAAMFEDLGI
jgi:DNA-damage-inducible protein J